MREATLLLLGLLGTSGGQHILPINVVHSENPYQLALASATAKDPTFIHGVMQLQGALPVSYSLDPDVVTVADSSSIEDELGQDPIAARLEQQEAAKEAAKEVRNRREVSTQESRNRPDYDRKDSSAGSGEDDGSSGDGFGYDRNAKAKLDEEMASAERAVAKYDKMFGGPAKFSTVGGDDANYGGNGGSGGGGDGAYGRGSGSRYGTSSGNDYGGRGSGTSTASGNNYALSAGDTGYRGRRGTGGGGEMDGSNNDYRRSGDGGYGSNDRYSPASGNDYGSSGGGGGGGGGGGTGGSSGGENENGNDGGYRPSRGYSGVSGSGGGDLGDGEDRYDADAGDNYGDNRKSDYSSERDKGFSQASGDGYGKMKGYDNRDESARGYGGNNNYAETGGSYKPVNREGSYSRSIDFHEKPKPKLKPYREILEEQDRKGGGAPFEANDDGYDGKTEGFDGNYKAEGFNGDEINGGGGGGGGGGGDRRGDEGQDGGSQEAASDGYGDSGGDGSGDPEVNEASHRPRDNEEKYATLDGPDYESQRGTDYYDRNEGRRGGEASERIGTVQGPPKVIKTDVRSRTPSRKGGTSFTNHAGTSGRPHRRHKRDTTPDDVPTPAEREIVAQEESAIDFASTSFRPGDGNEGDMREIPSSYDGIVTGSGFIEDIAPQGEVNSTTSSGTRVINYSAEEGFMPSRQAALEDDYLARTGRELGPAPPGMDPADERFVIGGFKPVFPIDDPDEGPDDLDRGRGPPNRVGEALDILPRDDFGKEDNDGGSRFNADSISPVASGYGNQSPPSYNGPYGPVPTPTRAPFANPPQALQYPPPAFQGKSEFQGHLGPLNRPPQPDKPIPLPSPAPLQDNPTLPTPLRQVSPVPFSDEPIETVTVIDAPPVRVVTAREQGTRYKHERTQIIQKQDIHRSTYGNNVNNHNKPTMPSGPVYRSQIHGPPAGIVTQYQQSRLVKPLRRARRSVGTTKIFSLEVTQRNASSLLRSQGSSTKVNVTGQKLFTLGTKAPKETVRSKRSAHRKKDSFYGSSESDEDCSLSMEESRVQQTVVAPPKAVVDLEASASARSSGVAARERSNSSAEPIITADTSNEEIMWGLQLARNNPNGKKRPKVVIINAGEENMKPQWFIAAPTPKPARGILGWLGFSRTTPARNFEEQIASDILGKLDDKDQVLLHHGELEDSAEKDDMHEEPIFMRRRQRRKYRRNRLSPSHHHDEDSRERFRPPFDASGEEPWDPIERKPRRKPLKLLVLPSSQEEPEEQANERLEIIHKYPRGGRKVYREYRPRHGNGSVKEKILVYSSSFGDPVVTLPEKHDHKRDVSTDKTFMKRSGGPKIKIISLQREGLPALSTAGEPGRFNFSIPDNMRRGFVILGKPFDGAGPLEAGRVMRKARKGGRTISLLKKPESGFAEITVSSTIKVKGE